jgi:predicted nucleic acid-binding protein
MQVTGDISVWPNAAKIWHPGTVDDAVAASYGQVAAAVVEAGRRLRARSMDLLIAATAHAHSARLYTRNSNDFHGLEELVDVIPV